jgi:CBS domain-containing protein
MGLKIEKLPVANYMTPYPISVKPEVSFQTVVNFMAERGIGNLVVSENATPIGILTEREILQCAVSKEATEHKKVKDIGTQPYIKITPDTSVLDATKIMISKKSRLLVFADNDKLVGIITASDMVRAFRKTDKSPSLDNVVSTKICTCSTHDTILDAAKLMYEKKIGSVIVVNGDKFGIFTERDLLVQVLANEVDMKGEVGGYSSWPLVTADKGVLANNAASIMAANNIKRLGLVRNGSLVGIVTARDLVDAYQNAYPNLNPYLE